LPDQLQTGAQYLEIVDKPDDKDNASPQEQAEHLPAEIEG